MSRITCPTCGSPVDRDSTPVMPFCSIRCQQVDLGRWFDEEYGLPIEREEEWPDEEASRL